IHRVGRTGRAGARGTASTFATRGERSEIGRIEKSIGVKLTRREVAPGIERESSARLAEAAHASKDMAPVIVMRRPSGGYGRNHGQSQGRGRSEGPGQGRSQGPGAGRSQKFRPKPRRRAV